MENTVPNVIRSLNPNPNLNLNLTANANSRSTSAVKLFGVTLIAAAAAAAGSSSSSSSSACTPATCTTASAFDDRLSIRKCVSLGNLALMNQNVMNSQLYVNNGSMISQYSSNNNTPDSSDSGPQPRSAATGVGAAGSVREHQGYVSDGLMQASCTSSRERKKGVPWTEDEHRMFLIGLQKLGKGDWRGISRNFVTSRTPTQVASHAQKYFLRQCNLNKRKRRPSLFDIISSNLDNSQQSSSMDFNLPTPELRLGHLVHHSSTLPPISPTDLFLGSRPNGQHQHHDLHRQQTCQESSPVSSKPMLTAEERNIIHLLPNKSFNMQHVNPESNIIRPTPSMASCSSLSSSSSSSSLCRIDETTELSSLNLSIGPPPFAEHCERTLKRSRHSAFHASGSASIASNTNTTLVNAISVG